MNTVDNTIYSYYYDYSYTCVFMLKFYWLSFEGCSITAKILNIWPSTKLLFTYTVFHSEVFVKIHLRNSNTYFNHMIFAGKE